MLVQDVHKQLIKPIDILRSYGKVAIKAHEKTNCLTEVMIAEAEQWTKNINSNGPLAGIPVSLKDSVVVVSFDVSVGYSLNTGKPSTQDGTLVRILRDAGKTPLYFQENFSLTMLRRSHTIRENQFAHLSPFL